MNRNRQDAHPTASGAGKADGGPPPRSDREVWRENFFQALDVIRTHKMRSGLLILGVAIGVTTVLAIVTVMTGLSRRIKEDIISADRPYLMVTRYDPMGDEDRSEIYRRKKLTVDDVRAIEETCRTVDRTSYRSPASHITSDTCSASR